MINIIDLSKVNRQYLYSIVSGLLLTISFPPFKTGFFAFGALVPFFFALEEQTPFQSFRVGYLLGFILSLATLYWVAWVTLAGAIALLFYQPVYFGIFAFLFQKLKHSRNRAAWFGVPFIWTALEFLRGFSELKFTWSTLGYTQTYYLPLIQYAEFTSVYGISFWLVTVNGILYYLFKNWKERDKAQKSIWVLISLFIFPLIYGYSVLLKKNEGGEKVSVSVIQPNIDPNAKWNKQFIEENLSILERLTRKEVKDNNPDLVVWPESALPFYFRLEQPFRDRVMRMVNEMNRPLFTGGVDYRWISDKAYQTYNSGFFLVPNSTNFDSYSKINLVAFGERVPYKEYFPFYKKLMIWQNDIGDFSPGVQYKVFNWNRDTNQKVSSLRFSSVICFESAFPDEVRKFTAAGSRLLLIITNDAWFGKTSGPYQHAQMAVFRAIENRVPVARSANSGISSLIDAKGRILESTDIYVEGSLTRELTLWPSQTFYARHGNVFSWICATIGGVILIMGFLWPKSLE